MGWDGKGGEKGIIIRVRGESNRIRSNQIESNPITKKNERS